jgi:hypothetical protein
VKETLTLEQYAADRAAAVELRGSMARIGKPFPVWAMATESKPPKDITNRSFRMPRNSAILYRNKTPTGADPAHYLGTMTDADDGKSYWVSLWVRTVKDQKVLEIRRVRKPN